MRFRIRLSAERLFLMLTLLATALLLAGCPKGGY